MNAIRSKPLTRAALFLVSALAFGATPDRNLSAQSSAQRECDRCSDLCPLVDEYWQKERGIELWKKYASSNDNRESPPDTVTDITSFQNFVKDKLKEELKGRTLPCRTVQEGATPQGNQPQAPPDDSVQTGLETRIFDASCDILYGNQKLEGATEAAWRNRHVCKGSADAELAHEQVHQDICRATWARNRLLAASRQAQFENIAQSELQAWRRHRNRLRDQILNLASKCGWEPTDRQKLDPNAVPTEKQTKQMENLGWKAFEALNGSADPRA